MTLLVPEKTSGQKTGAPFPELNDLLISALEVIRAAAGWIALQDADGGLIFPIRGGVFPDSWLDWPQGRGSVWGFAVSGEPAVLNDLKPWSKFGDPPLRNLLSYPLIHNDQILGHVALANKEHGFAAEDTAILQGLAHHMVRLLGRRLVPSRSPIELSAAWRRILDRAGESILFLDESGTLIYANATWLDWTGFRAEELLGRTAPFPFWVSQQDLLRALKEAPVVSDRALPFRRRDQSVFWCLLEAESQRWDDHPMTVAFLQQTAALSPTVAEADSGEGVADRSEPQPLRPATPEWLPLLLDLDGGVQGWGPRWEERTGLSAHDVEGSRSELVLDWLFPQQHDRERVADCFLHPSAGCQLDLAIATLTGSQPVLCTFLPWAAGASIPAPRRWLLLVSEPGSTTSFHRTIRPDPSSPPHGPHPHDQPAAIVPPDKTEPQP